MRTISGISDKIGLPLIDKSSNTISLCACIQLETSIVPLGKGTATAGGSDNVHFHHELALGRGAGGGKP